MKKHAAFLLIALAVAIGASSQTSNTALADTTGRQNGWYIELAGQAF